MSAINTTQGIITQNFDALYASGRFARYPNEAVVRFLAARICDGATLLDIGCGAGRHLKLASELDFIATGLDVSQEAIDKAKDWLRHYESEYSEKFVVADLTALPFPDNHFDLAIAFGSFYYGTPADMRAAISELHRVLVPGGEALVNLRNDNDWRQKLNGLDEYGNPLTLMNYRDAHGLFEPLEIVSLEMNVFQIGDKTNCDNNFVVRK